MALTRPKYSQIYDTDWKNSVKLATTADVGDLLASNAQPNSVDGVSLTINDRILVKDQGNSLQNGLYFVRTVGTGANGWWARTLDANQDAFVTGGLTVDVTNGTINSNRTYRLTTPDPVYLGNTALTFSLVTGQPGGANTYVQFYDQNNQIGGTAGFTFNKTSNLVTIGGNVSATYVLGSGQFLTGLPASYSNVNVAAYTQTQSYTNYSNVNVASYLAGQINTTGNILSTGAVHNNVVVNTGNINAVGGYFVGNGYFLTGIVGGGASSYSNVQVATYLPTYSGTVGASLINSTGNVLATGLSIFGNIVLGSLAVPGALNTLAGNVTIYGASSMLNVIGNIVVNNTAISSSNVTGAIVTTGGIGVGGNVYHGQRSGFVWGANNVSSVYQVFNNSTNSLDTVFG